MSLESLVTNYGYYAIVIGTFFEGETILVIAGFLASRGYLELPFVITAAFLGAIAGDQLYFYIGRIKGRKFIDKKPSWKSKANYVSEQVDKHPILLIIGYRFLYGVRTVTPFALGASGVSPIRYLVLSICGASAWALFVGVLGYYFGNALESLFGKIKQYEIWIILGLLTVGALVWGLYKWRDKKARMEKAR